MHIHGLLHNSFALRCINLYKGLIMTAFAVNEGT